MEVTSVTVGGATGTRHGGEAWPAATTYTQSADAPASVAPSGGLINTSGAPSVTATSDGSDTQPAAAATTATALATDALHRYTARSPTPKLTPATVTVAPPPEGHAGAGDDTMLVMLGGAYASSVANGADAWFRTEIWSA